MVYHQCRAPLILLFCIVRSGLCLPNIIETNSPKSFSIDPAKLPRPSNDRSRPNRVIAMNSASTLTVPRGFKVNIFAGQNFNFTNPRNMILSSNGDIFVADSNANRVVIIRDADKDGRADRRFVFTNKLSQPYGLAFHNTFLYVANTDSVVRFPYAPGQTVASGNPERLLELTAGGGHWTRNIVFAPDNQLFVSIGSASNNDEEKDPRRGAVTVQDENGKNQKLFATGLRNPVGLAINPTTGTLWTAVNERDGLGNELVPDFVTSLRQGEFFGWPWFYIGKNQDPAHVGKRPDLADKVRIPDVLIQAHSAALGIAFYTGQMFPKEYHSDLFVALHGSWNRAQLTGYKVVRIPFANGVPRANRYEDFVTGWMVGEDSADVWGRPCGLLVNSDGSLLIADDGGKRIWRVSF